MLIADHWIILASLILNGLGILAILAIVLSTHFMYNRHIKTYKETNKKLQDKIDEIDKN